jgi:hypothetical protein
MNQDVLSIVQTNLTKACSLVPSSVGSTRPVSRFSLEIGFFNNDLPTFTKFSKFSFVATSTVATVPVKESSYLTPF